MTDKTMPSEKSLPISKASYDRARQKLHQVEDKGRTRMETWDEFFNRMMDDSEALETKKPGKARPSRAVAPLATS